MKTLILILNRPKLHENILIYDIIYKTLIGAKHIRFDKIDGFIRTYDGNRYLRLFSPEKSDDINGRIIYLISQKSGIACAFCHYYAKIKVCSFDSLPIYKNINIE